MSTVEFWAEMSSALLAKTLESSIDRIKNKIMFIIIKIFLKQYNVYIKR